MNIFAFIGLVCGHGETVSSKMLGHIMYDAVQVRSAPQITRNLRSENDQTIRTSIISLVLPVFFEVDVAGFVAAID